TPSVTGSEGAAQQVVERFFAERGLAVDCWEATAAEIAGYEVHVGEQAVFEGRPNVAGKLAGRGKGRSILLNAHIDTVETGDPATWTVDPLGGALIDGKVYGRGAC